jgi:hypothetical protein
MHSYLCVTLCPDCYRYTLRPLWLKKNKPQSHTKDFSKTHEGFLQISLKSILLIINYNEEYFTAGCRKKQIAGKSQN